MLCFAFAIGTKYKKYLAMGLSELEEYLAFLKHIKGRVYLNAEDYRTASLGFESQLLSELGFIEAIKEGRPLHSAYEKAKERMLLPSQADSVIDECFASLGKADVATETRTLQLCIEELNRICCELKESVHKKTRSAFALLFASGLGLVILLV